MIGGKEERKVCGLVVEVVGVFFLGFIFFDGVGVGFFVVSEGVEIWYNCVEYRSMSLLGNLLRLLGSVEGLGEVMIVYL